MVLSCEIVTVNNTCSRIAHTDNRFYIVDFIMDPLPVMSLDDLTLPPLPTPPPYQTVDLTSVFLPTHDLYPEVNSKLKYTQE